MTHSHVFLRLANTADDSADISLANATAIEIDADGWAVIPYGDTHHNAVDGRAAANARVPEELRRGVIQRFTRAAAEALDRDFRGRGWLGRIKRAFVGLPVYKGHPDAPRFANLFPDKAARGAIGDMQVTDAGLRIRPVLTEQGAADVEGGWGQFSPYWDLRFTGEKANGLPVVEPFRLHSIGLVRRGNMPGLSLVNADLSIAMLKELLIKLLAALGVTMPPETADDAIAPFVDDAIAKLEGMKPKAEAEAELATANAAKSELEQKVNTLTTDLAAANAKVTELEGEKLTLANAKIAAEEAMQAERKERAALLIAAAVADGRVKAADKDAKILALANASDFAAEAAALAAIKPELKTRSILGDVTKTGRDQQDRRGQMLSLVNAHMETAKCDYTTAWDHVAKSDQGKAILSSMKKPGAQS